MGKGETRGPSASAVCQPRRASCTVRAVSPQVAFFARLFAVASSAALLWSLGCAQKTANVAKEPTPSKRPPTANEDVAAPAADRTKEWDRAKAARFVIDAAALTCLQKGECRTPAVGLADLKATFERTRLDAAIAGLTLDVDVLSVSESAAPPVLTTEEPVAGQGARFAAADLWHRLRTAPMAKRSTRLASGAQASSVELQALAPVFGISQRPQRVAARVGITAEELNALVDTVLEQTEDRARELAVHPANLPATLWSASEATATGALTGPLYRGTPPPQPAVVSGCFWTGPTPADIVWTTGPERAQSGAEQLARIRAASCAAELSRRRMGKKSAQLIDATWVRAISEVAAATAPLAPSDGAAKARMVGRLLRLRRAALATRLALLDRVPTVQERDAAATEWTLPGSPPVEGAGFLLPVDATGRVAESLVAMLLASAIEHHLVVQHGMRWDRRGREGESLTSIDALYAAFNEGGVESVFAKVGEPKVTAALLLTTFDATAR